LSINLFAWHSENISGTPPLIDPFLSIETPKPTENHRPDALFEEEVIRLFLPGVLKDVMQRAVCAAIFWVGLRWSELWALRPEDLDWKTPKITVCHAWKNFDRKFRELGDPKHHKKRIAPFPDELQQAIRDLWEANGRHKFVFSKKDGRVPGPSWIRYHLPRWLVRAGIEADGRTIKPHSSRHSLASMLEAQGVPLRYIQDMLGHSDLKTTLGYLHSPQGTINRIARKIGEIQHQTLKPNEQDTG
jgi:integrase